MKRNINSHFLKPHMQTACVLYEKKIMLRMLTK